MLLCFSVFLRVCFSLSFPALLLLCFSACLLFFLCFSGFLILWVFLCFCLLLYFLVLICSWFFNSGLQHVFLVERANDTVEVKCKFLYTRIASILYNCKQIPHTQTYAYLHICIYTHMHRYIHIHIHILICIHTCMQLIRIMTRHAVHATRSLWSFLAAFVK